MRLFEFLKNPDYIEPLKDKNEINRKYKEFRIKIFLSCFLGYIVFHFVRKNLAVALPDMSNALGFSNTELGLLGASLYLTYGIGRFCNGILADRTDVRKFMAISLFFSGFANLCFIGSAIFITPGEYTFFGLPTSSIMLWLLVFFWGVNGWFQSGGFPPITKSLSYWFSNSERGRIWALWSTSHQFGILLSVQLASWAIQKYNWHAAFIMPAIISMLFAVILYCNLRDKPQTIGLPDIEVYKKEVTEKCAEGLKEKEDKRSYFEIYKANILCNKVIWLLAIIFIFVYTIRFGTEDWLIKYFVESKGNSLAVASDKLSLLAFCGIFGVLVCGTLSDIAFKGKRAPVNILYLIGIIVSLLGIYFTPSSLTVLDFFFVGMLGFCTSGPQMMIGGLCAIEASSKKVAAASTGFIGIFGYLGAVVSALGTGFMVDKFKWEGALIFWIISACICIIICSFLVKKEGSNREELD